MIDKIKSLIADLNPDDDMLLISLLKQKIEYGEKTGIDLTRFKLINKRSVETSFIWLKSKASDFLSETIFKKESDRIAKVNALTQRIGICSDCKHSVDTPSKYENRTYLSININSPICQSCHNRCIKIDDHLNELNEELWEKKNKTLDDNEFSLMLNDFATLRVMMNTIIEKNKTIKNKKLCSQ